MIGLGLRRRDWAAAGRPVATSPDWVHFWNTRLLHGACSDIPPAEFDAITMRSRSAHDVDRWPTPASSCFDDSGSSEIAVVDDNVGMGSGRHLSQVDLLGSVVTIAVDSQRLRRSFGRAIARHPSPK